MIKTMGEVNLSLDKLRAPFYALSLIKEISEVTFIVKTKSAASTLQIDDNTAVALTKDPELKLFVKTLQGITIGKLFKLKFDNDNPDEVVMVVKFRLKPNSELEF